MTIGRDGKTGKVFTSDYQLTIPSFQRADTWQAENIETVSRQRPSGRCRRPAHFLLPGCSSRQGRPHIPGHRRPTSRPHLRQSSSPCCGTGRRPRPHRQPTTTSFLEPGDENSAASKPTAAHPSRERHRLLPHVRAGKAIWKGLFDLRTNDIASRATQHRRHHRRSRPASPPWTPKATADSLIPGQTASPPSSPPTTSAAPH